MIFLLSLLILIFPLQLFSQDTYDEYIFTHNEGITVVRTVQTSQQMTIVEKEQIERCGVNDLANLLQETLGLNIVRYGAYGNQAGINLRGFDSKRVAFLIDGVQVNSSLDGKFDINQIDLSSIERIEVIYGGSDSKYNVSGAFGGIVNIITVKKQEQGLKLAASVSNTSVKPGTYRNRSDEMQNPHWEDLFDTQHYSLSAVYGSDVLSLTAAFSANRADNHFIFLDQTGKLRRKDNNEVWDAGAAASVVWELADSDSLLAKFIVSSNIFYGDRNIPASGFSSYIGNQSDFSARQNFMIDMPRVFHENLSSELSAAWQFHRLDYTSPADSTSLHDQHNLTLVNRWNWLTGDWLILRSGVDYRYINLNSTEIGNRSRHDGGFYLTAEFHPAKSFVVIPSAKMIFTHDGSSSNLAVIPKLGLLWNVSENLTIKNNYFRSFKFPDFEELYWSGGGVAVHGAGNPDLQPEDGYGADLGVSWHVTEKLRLENVFFTQWIRNSIHWFAGSGGIWRPENVGEAVFFGLNNKVVYNIPVSTGFINEITASLSYQYLLSYLLSYGYTFNSNKRIPYNPEHTLNGSLEIFWKTGSLSLSGQYESLRYHDTNNITALKPVFLLNAGVNQKMGNYLAMFGTLRNILNTSYESFYDYPMPGITLTLGVRVNLEFK